MKSVHYPVVIVGAGPAGVTTSLFLQAEKIPHLIIERDRFPRDKICGDAVSGKALEILAKLYPQEIKDYSASEKALLSYGIQFSSPNGKSVDISFPKPKGDLPVGFVSRRSDFDNFLYSLAVHSGSEIIQGSEIKSVSRAGQRITIKGEFDGQQKEISTSLIIAADGSRSVVKKSLHGDDQDDNHFCGGIRGYFTGVKGLHKNNYLELHFLKELLPGYFWIFPLSGGAANVGMGMLSKDIKSKRINLRKEMLQVIQSHPVISKRFTSAVLEDSIKGWGLPLGSKKRKISGDNYLLVGDAASLIDPFTGEGIGNAVVSGLVASRIAKKALEAGNFSSSYLSEFDAIIYSKLWNELKLSHRIQRLTTYPLLFNFMVNRINSNTNLQNIFTNMFTDLDLRSKMKNPLFYLRILFNN